MIPLVFSRDALREMDRVAVEHYHIPLLSLMENAGRAVADAARKLLKPKGQALILAGSGNNGGDGFVAARHLHNAGFPVSILLLKPREAYQNAAAAQLAIVDAMNLSVDVLSSDHAELRDWIVDSSPGDLLIDALFGTGLSRPTDGLAAATIKAANNSAHPILAVDIPSGLDADSGELLGEAIRATETLSFSGTKLGFSAPSAKRCIGKLTTIDIGIPLALLKKLASPPLSQTSPAG